MTDTDLNIPTWMRAPGAVSGMFALECAMDELAYALQIDPLELRLINDAEVDPESGRPGRARRCGSATHSVRRSSVEGPHVRAALDARRAVAGRLGDGHRGLGRFPGARHRQHHVQGGRHGARHQRDQRHRPRDLHGDDHDRRRVPGAEAEQVQFELGDTQFPRAPSQGGSKTTASVGSAVHGAALAVGARLLSLANRDANSPLKVAAAAVEMLDGRLQLTSDPSRFVRVSDVMRRNGLAEITETFESRPRRSASSTRRWRTAQFVEVKVDPDLGPSASPRAIEVTACGTIINPKTSHSQEIGGGVWGIGMALHEATEIDHRYGRIINPNLQHYHVPANADVHEIETTFVEEDDTVVNPLGVKGMGELGMVGIPAAIANAVFHATGRRIRALPMTPEMRKTLVHD